MAEAENIQRVKDSYSALFRGDLPAFLDMVADDFTIVVPGPADLPGAGIHRGKQAVSDLLTAVGNELDIQVMDVQSYIAQGDHVVVVVYEEAVVRRTGRRCIDEEVHLMTFRDGQFVQWQEFLDTAALVAAYRDQ